FDAESGLRDEAQSSPFEIGAQFKDFGHSVERAAISLPRDYTLVLVLDLLFVVIHLAQQHNDGLQKIQRFESGDYNGFAFVCRNPSVRSAADDCRDVART